MAVLLTIGPAAATAQEIALPSKPDMRAVAQSHSVPRGFIGMFETIVVRHSDGRFEVLYGFIFGNMRRDGLTYAGNDITGTSCEGATVRQPDKSGLGKVNCTSNGTIVSISPIEIASGVYGKIQGIDAGVVLDISGKQIGTVITQWNGWDFPDAMELVRMFKP